jgi:hypothetical protein
MPELKPLKLNMKKLATIRKGINQIIECDRGMCGYTQDALDMLDDIETMNAREKLLLDALRPFAKRAEYFDKVARQGGWDEVVYVDDPPSDIYVKQLRAAYDLISKFDAEEHR